MIELAAGRDRVAVDVAAGGRIASFIAGGRERLVTSPAPGLTLPSVGWGSFVMAPWVGRIRLGSIDWAERRLSTPANFGAHAIHGTGFDTCWSVKSAGPRSVDLETELNPSRWPFRGHLVQRLELSPGRLELTAGVVAAESMPAAVGWHPWFRYGVDEILEVQLDTSAFLRASADRIPTGDVLPVTAETDLRRPRRVDRLDLDHVFVGVKAPAVLAWPDLRLRIAWEPPVETVVVYTAPGSICVEPQTAWPDAMRLRALGHDETGLAVLEAGNELTARSEWMWQPA